MHPKTRRFRTAFLSLALALSVAGCEPFPASGPGSASGRVSDASGDGLPGTIVVVGDSSTTLFTDRQGGFTVGGIEGSVPVRMLAPGYLSRRVVVGADQAGVDVRMAEDPAPEKAPSVSAMEVASTPAGIEVRAVITAAPGASIVDARAELLGTPDGVVLSRGTGDEYSGVIPSSNPSHAPVLVFAVDGAGRHGEEVRGAGGPPGGSATGAAERWAGSLFGVNHGWENFGRYLVNASLSVSAEGGVDGLVAHVRLGRLEAGLDPLVSDALTGAARMVGKNYQLEVADAAGKVDLTLMGNVEMDGGLFTGFAHGKVAGGPFQAGFVFVNTRVLPDPWSPAALARLWGLSFFHKNQPERDPATYQVNSLVAVNLAGEVVPQTPTTLGARTLPGATLSFSEVAGESLGYFTGDPGLAWDDGTAYALHGFMAVGRWRVHGVWSSTGPAFGTFWGRRHPFWSPAHFDAQWQGAFVVTSGPDAGQVLNAQVNLNSNGGVTGAGSVVAGPGGTLAGGNISLHAGSLAFVHPAVGGVRGSFSGTQQGLPVTVDMSTPELPETASMGVYHGRLIGKFSISSNGDAGFYFLHRNSRN